MDTKETPATKAAGASVPQRVPGDICALATLKTSLTQEEIILAYLHVLPIGTQNREDTQDPFNIILKCS